MSDTDLIEILKQKLAWQQRENARLTEDLNAANSERDEFINSYRSSEEAREGLRQRVTELQREASVADCQRQFHKEEVQRLRQRVSELETFVKDAANHNYYHLGYIDIKSAAAKLSTQGGDEKCQSQPAGANQSLGDTSSDAPSTIPAVSNPPPTSEPEAGATPETDAQFAQIQTAKECADFARNLERQRDAAIARVEELEKYMKMEGEFRERQHMRIVRLENDKHVAEAERDELRTQHAADAKEIAELKERVESAAYNRLIADMRADRAEAACAAMQEAIEKSDCGPNNDPKNPYKCKYSTNRIAREWKTCLCPHHRLLATDPGKAFADRLAAAEADTKAIRQLEKLVWSGKVNHYAIAPYRYGKTDEKRISILAIPDENDVTMDSEELGDGATLREAIDAAMKGTTNE